MSAAADCGCTWLDGAHTWVMCTRHYADLEAELEREPEIVPALLALAKRWCE